VADRAVLKAGVPREQVHAFYEHLRSNPNALMQAVQPLVFGRDVSALQKLAREWGNRGA
jgi:hypothetical protein